LTSNLLHLDQARVDQARDVAAATPFAVIDVGSNSVRLVVFEGLVSNALAIFNERDLCGLGKGIGADNCMRQKAVDNALRSIERFVHLSAEMGAGVPKIVATAAVRNAANGSAFVANVLARTGVTVDVLSGREEARLSSLGVMDSIPDADGLMGDLGGGSLELVDLKGSQIGQGVTLPLGALFLNNRFPDAGPDVKEFIDRQLAEVGWLEQLKGRTFYAVGGNWRALAKLHQAQSKYPLRIVHHYRLPAEDARDLAKIIARLSADSIDRLKGVTSRRRGSLPTSSLVLSRLLKLGKPSDIVFSGGGLREGVLNDHLSEEERRRDPLIEMSVRLGRRETRYDGLGFELEKWMRGLFTGETKAEARIRTAAALMSDTAWRTHPDYRAEAAFKRVLYAPLSGINHKERAMISLAVYVRYAGDESSDFTSIARKLVTDDEYRWVCKLGLALRLGQTLSGGTPGVLSRSQIAHDNGPLVLTLIEEDANFLGPSVDKRLKALGNMLNREWEVVIAQT
jgi:exopolyphosphatase / guanosine-5'-triphosphate,3'-diphosphate pyrophosphatase